MPRFTSSHNASVDYNATLEKHKLIEAWLSRAAAKYGADEAEAEIAYIVKVQRATTGNEILRWLDRRFSNQRPIPPSGPEDTVDASVILQAFRDNASAGSTR